VESDFPLSSATEALRRAQKQYRFQPADLSRVTLTIARNTLVIGKERGAACGLRIFDLTGRTVFSAQLRPEARSVSIDIRSLPLSGSMYIAAVSATDGKTMKSTPLFLPSR